MSHSIYIAYGSESGNSKQLALELNDKFAEFSPILKELNEIALSELTTEDTLVIVTSSFGDGEPPGNATAFADSLHQDDLQVDCKFAVFGLGDVSYPKFCGFSAEVDEKLRELGGIALAHRVDADLGYQEFFNQWSDELVGYFKVVFNSTDGADSKELEEAKAKLGELMLQVKSYGDDNSFMATIEKSEQINKSGFAVYDIDINIAGSGMNYQAGDLLYILPPVNEQTFERVKAFYRELSDKQIGELATKELRLLTKPLLRKFVKAAKNDEIKALLKVSASKQLAEYIYGRDIADVLNDFYSSESMPITTLLDILSAQAPRAYSIASCGLSSPDNVRLCVREVAYTMNDNDYVGSGSHFLASSETGAQISVYVRSSPHFHLPKPLSTEKAIPIIMIGAGTGIAPYLGFLENMAKTTHGNDNSGKDKYFDTHLFFGERHKASDFLYEETLNEYHNSGVLNNLYTAFSRDGDRKYYVQDELLAQGETLWKLISNDAHIYVCGSKANLSKPIDNALQSIAMNYGGLGEDEAKQLVFDLVSAGRYHQDLY